MIFKGLADKKRLIMNVFSKYLCLDHVRILHWRSKVENKAEMIEPQAEQENKILPIAQTVNNYYV